MNAIAKITSKALIVLALCIASPNVRAQDPLTIGPKVYKLVFENERIRVMEMRLKPGEKVGMHSHPDYVVYILAPGKLIYTFPEGSPLTSDTKIGEVLWGQAGKHAAENVGKTEINALVIELKDPANDKGKDKNPVVK